MGGENVYFHHGAAPLFHATVVVNLRAWAGGAFDARRAPPVVFVPVTVDAVNRDADLVTPDFESLVVVQVDSNEEPFRVQLKDLCDQLPSKIDRALLEVVADAEVAQHFKEGKVFMVPYFFNVGGPKALLTACEPVGRRGLLSHEKRLERHHPGAGEQQGWVPRRNQRSAGHRQVTPFFEEPGKCLPYLVASHDHPLTRCRKRQMKIVYANVTDYVNPKAILGYGQMSVN